jgi:hypothetical protein
MMQKNTEPKKHIFFFDLLFLFLQNQEEQKDIKTSRASAQSRVMSNGQKKIQRKSVTIHSPSRIDPTKMPPRKGVIWYTAPLVG